MAQITRRDFTGMGLGALAGLLRSRWAPAAAKRSTLVLHVNPRRYHVQHRATVTNGDVELSQLEIWLPVPKNSPGQRIIGLQIRPEAQMCRTEGGQAEVAKLYLDRAGLPAPGGTCELQVSYDAVSYEIIARQAEMMALPYQVYKLDKAYRRFTRAEKKIETEAPGIAEQAKRLRGERRPAAHVARDAYGWVLDRTAYREVDGLGGALYCYENRHGECGDYSALFVALCRAAGVPARVVTGLYADGKDRWHVWAEFMLPTGEWIPVDPQVGDQNDLTRAYCFGRRDNRRVALCRSLEIKLLACRQGRHEAPYLQSGVFWWRTDSPPTGPARPQATFTVVGQPLATRPPTSRPR